MLLKLSISLERTARPHGDHLKACAPPDDASYCRTTHRAPAVDHSEAPHRPGVRPAVACCFDLLLTCRRARGLDRIPWEVDQGIIGIVPYISMKEANTGAPKLNSIGTAARVVRVTRIKRNGGPLQVTVYLEGLCRFSIDSYITQSPRVAKVTQLDMFDDEASEEQVEDESLSMLVKSFKAATKELIDLLQARVPLVTRLTPLLNTLPSNVFCDILVSALDASYDERLSLLNAVNLETRYKLALGILQRQLLLLRTSSTVSDHVEGQFSRGKISLPAPARRNAQDETVDAIDAPQDEEDTDSSENSILDRLRSKIAEAKMPPEPKRACLGELRKIQTMEKTHNIGPEHQKAVAYLEWMTALPWSKSSKGQRSATLKSALETLDRDHYGMKQMC